ncbi:MAG TPA: hypothetical protein VF412_20010 [Bdellovibrio sp.]|uniref:hypothetical protein n=1 Tax=Bdellovibrio sp. TaxID=28201 RepID=UPI002F09890A
MKKLMSVILCLGLSACASKELRIHGQEESSTALFNMEVSAEINEDYSDPYNILLQINFESNDGKWIRIDEAEVFTDNKEDAFNVIVGKDLVSWAEAKDEEKKIRDHNTEMTDNVITGVGGAAVVLGILTGDKNIAAAGLSGVAAGAGMSAYHKISEKKKNAQGVKMVPEGHLYAPFTVPSMSLTKRWVLINCPSGRVSKVIKLRLKTVEGESVTYKINLMERS